MKTWLYLLFHAISVLVKLSRPGGLKAIIAENLSLKQQLIVVNRRIKRSPKLTLSERLLFGFFVSWMDPKRLLKTAIIVKPSTFLKLHQALIKRKYRRLFSNKSPKKPGPKGPSQELIKAIVEMKRLFRNPRGYVQKVIKHLFVLKAKFARDCRPNFIIL